MTVFPPGEAQAVLVKAEAKSKAIRLLSDALTEQVNSYLDFFNGIILTVLFLKAGVNVFG